MARLFVKLKLKLLRAGIRASGISGLISIILAISLALFFGLAGGLLFSLLRVATRTVAAETVPFAFAGLLLIWVLGPIVSVGSDGTLEVDKLVLFPLRRNQLMPGLLLAAIVGVGGVATVLTLLGSIVGMAPLSPAMAITLLAAVLELAICVAASRLVSTAISGAQTRRWRDLALFLGPLIGIGINLVFQFYVRTKLQFGSTAHGERGGAFMTAVRVAVRLLPSGPPAEAMVAARAGSWALAAVELLAGGVYLLGLLGLWWRAIQKVLTTSPAAAGPRRGRAGGGAAQRPSHLLPRWLPFLPANRVGAVAARELRTVWREPRQRAAMLSSLFPGVLPLLSFGALTSHNHSIVLFAAVPMYMMAATGTNQFGFDGQRHWMNVAAGEDIRSDLRGKNLTRALFAATVGVIAAVGLAAKTGGWEMVIPALALGVAVFGIDMGLANVASIIGAYPMPDTRGNVFSAGSAGQGLAAIGPAFLVLLGRASSGCRSSSRR